MRDADLDVKWGGKRDEWTDPTARVTLLNPLLSFPTWFQGVKGIVCSSKSDCRVGACGGGHHMIQWEQHLPLAKYCNFTCCPKKEMKHKKLGEFFAEMYWSCLGWWKLPTSSVPAHSASVPETNPWTLALLHLYRISPGCSKWPDVLLFFSSSAQNKNTLVERQTMINDGEQCVVHFLSFPCICVDEMWGKGKDVRNIGHCGLLGSLLVPLTWILAHCPCSVPSRLHSGHT